MTRPINLDITNRCLLQCSKCSRTLNMGLTKQGGDMSPESMHKICKYYSHISFCGQRGDPIYHPKFIELLEICNNYDLSHVEINTNGTGKSPQWWKKAALINRDYDWAFALDGLPHKSHLYRVNQDGEQVFKIMKYLRRFDVRVHWRYIAFKYNEHDISVAKKLAKKYGIKFELVVSSRWDGPDDPLRPVQPNLSIDRGKYESPYDVKA